MLLIQELLAHISIGLEADLIPENDLFLPFFARFGFFLQR
jgi:hypothetical protein